MIFLAGFFFGFIGSMPIAGPVSALVFERALHGRFRSGLFVAMGGALAEGAYAFMAAWGLGAYLAAHERWLFWSRAVGAVILIGLGAFLALRKPHAPKPPSAARKGGAFVLGFSITALNPTLILTWTAAVTALYASRWVQPNAAQALPLALGAALGIVTWFSCLLALVRRFHERVQGSAIQKIVRATGVFLVILGMAFGLRLLRAN